MSETRDEIPRRAYVNKWTTSETAIMAALEAVEAMPADVRLTDAVVLLKAAFDSAADYTDGINRRRTAIEVQPTPPADKCPACRGIGGGEGRMGGDEWTCGVCHGTGRRTPPAEGRDSRAARPEGGTMTTPGWDGARLQLEPIRKRLSRGQYRTLPAETTEGDIAYLLARCEALETALRELMDAWQQRIAISERDVAAGEYSQAGCDSERGKRCVLRECIGEVRALLSAEPPAPKEGQ